MSQGLRYDNGKIRLELLSPIALLGVSRVLTKGANKYADHNWRKGMAWSKCIGPLLRHLMLFMMGIDRDADGHCPDCRQGLQAEMEGRKEWYCKNHTGELHIDQVLCNAMFLSEFARTHKNLDDRCRQDVSDMDSLLGMGAMVPPATGTKE